MNQSNSLFLKDASVADRKEKQKDKDFSTNYKLSFFEWRSKFLEEELENIAQRTIDNLSLEEVLLLCEQYKDLSNH